MQKLYDKEIKVEGLSLPKAVQIGIDTRNDNGNNHIFENGVIKVLCSQCKKYHPVFQLKAGEWADINETYWISKTRGTKEPYLSSKCIKCYEKNLKKPKKEKKTVEIVSVAEEKSTKKEDEYLPHSKKNGGIQQTIFLTSDNDKYLKWFAFVNNKRKNELINQVIAKFREENPINL